MKRPWNIVNMPVYSLATYNEDEVNMNICTYVSAVSMKPKLFMVAIDYQTKTFENLEQSDTAILQVLHEDQASLIKLLGKKSGKKINKANKLRDKNQLIEWSGHEVLEGACGYLFLQMEARSNISGDHELFYFSVTKSTTKSEEGILMFRDLIRQGIIL
ncbi:MAG: flavin reductase [Ekhidna sp.]|nr:flavin reductase [Ekhidna sp.]